MNIRYRTITRVLLAGLATGFILSGCNEYYARPDYDYKPGYDPGYGPGYDEVGDRRMIKNCKLRVENKISRKLDYSPRINFGYVDVSDISRYRSRIEGDAYVHERNGRLRVDYRCIVERDNGKVSDLKLDWRDKPASGGNKKQAVSICKSHIRNKVQRNTDGQVNIDFRKHETSNMSGNRLRISGKANVSARRGQGKIGYECVVDTSRMRIIDASYSWKQELNAAGGNGYDKDRAIRRCHKAITNKLRKDDYHHSNIQTTKVRGAGKSDLIIEGKLIISIEDWPRPGRYQCRVNGHNGNVKSASYKLDY